MTRNLLNALKPPKEGTELNIIDENDDYDNYLAGDGGVNDNLIDLEHPTSFWHLVKILVKTDVKQLFALSNPDGYFYLVFIKTSIKFFSLALLVAGFPMSYVCYITPTLLSSSLASK